MSTQDLVPQEAAVPAAELPTTPSELPVVEDEFEKALELAAKDAIEYTGFVGADGIPVVLHADHVEITLDGGVKRMIPYEGLKALIDRTVNVQEVSTSMEGMLLPSNVFFISQSANELRMSCYFPGGVRDMLYGSSKKTIVTPNIIISHLLKKDNKDWIVKASYYMCTDLPVNKLPKDFLTGPRNSAGVYLLPMSNTYSEGNMCYGSNSMPARYKDNQFRGLDWYFKFLWETPFNDDLGIRAVRDVSVRTWYDTLAARAKDNKPFPYADLVGWKQMDGAPVGEKAVTR